MNYPGRIVALDVGTKRIGVAACDPTRTLVRVVGMVPARPIERAITSINRILQDEEAVELVIGLPWTLEGEIGPQAQRVIDFVDQLRPSIYVPITFYDERLTSAEAERLLNERGGFSREDRRNGRVDEIAAGLILEDYLQEARFRTRRLPVEDENLDGE
ncbi:MAG: Holliday junction resolvase RuvX [Herpetosiphonaceae bacterium]|nr:Holliday junction resolvase RuvX [Herpetosiphonaceae bacterium]